MKKILFIILVTIASLNAKPCMTDIYFGNGVWNIERQAKDGRKALREFMLTRANTHLDIQKEGITYNFKHAYNPSHGTLLDLVETFWQLKESGQISDGYFHSIYASLMSSRDGNHYYDRLQQIINTYNGDINTIFAAYKTSSFDQKHNVLLVAHSQGNLFGNKMYALLTSEQKKKFRMVSVATPASYVMQENQISPYVTATLDYIIGPIPGSLPGNVDGIGHTFISTYLHSSFEARTKIAQDVKSAYDALMQTTTCTEYDYVFFRIYETDNLKVVAKQSNIFINDIIGEVNIEYTITDTIKNNTYYCGDDYPSYYFHPSLDHQLDYMIWNVSPFFSKSELESNKGSILKYQFGNRCATISLSGDVYDLALSALE